MSLYINTDKYLGSPVPQNIVLKGNLCRILALARSVSISRNGVNILHDIIMESMFSFIYNYL